MGMGIVAAEATASDINVVKPACCTRSAEGIGQPMAGASLAGLRFTAMAGQIVGSAHVQRILRQLRRARSFSR